MRFLPAAVNGDKKLLRTSDGSFTFYNISYGESYKTKSAGAYTESLHKFVRTSGITELIRRKNVRLLDICLGVGMNLAVTLDEIMKSKNFYNLETVSVELDRNLVELIKNTGILIPYEGYKILRKLLDDGRCGSFSLDLHITDASDFIKNLTGSFDVVYFDPFSKNRNPEMWTAGIFEKLYEILTPGGKLVTYASSREVRELIENAGFSLSKAPSVGRRKHPSLLAVK